MKKVWLLIFKSAVLAYCLQAAMPADVSAQVITDNYEIYFGPVVEAYPGEPAVFVPIHFSTSQAATQIHIIIAYDQILLTPNHVAPNIFFQSFIPDISTPGLIRIDAITDLPPPPVIPPLNGDTIFAWISFAVTSRDLGWDYLTNFTFFEDIHTPLPDNYIILENNGVVFPPALTLTPGSFLIIHPLYGDINLNGHPYDIGDAVTFFNYFMGHTQFNRHQYANSDCNRDGVQATIADLVYMLRIINGDTILLSPPMLNPEKPAIASYNYEKTRQFPIYVAVDAALGGAFIECAYDQNIITPVGLRLSQDAGYFDLQYSIAADGRILITIINWDQSNNAFSNGQLLTIDYISNEDPASPFTIVRAEFSDNAGYPLSGQCTPGGFCEPQPVNDSRSGDMLTGYPNPFNSQVQIQYNIPAYGYYKIEIYDMLGRMVRELFSGYSQPGPAQVIWDGSNQNNSTVVSGIYFVRLQGDQISSKIKLHLLK